MNKSPIHLIGLVSSYREGRLVRSAIDSLAPHVDQVYVLEGPFGTPPEQGEPSDLLGMPGNALARLEGPWDDDAAKRTRHAEWVTERHLANDTRPLWAVILDGDEVLMFGEHLRIHCERARPADRMISTRITNWDGTVERTFHRIIRVDLIERYELGAHRFFWKDSPELCVAPNYAEICADVSKREEVEAARTMIQPPYRWPLHGEPHILHRPYLRADGRFDERASDAEAAWAIEQAARLGVA